jgi:hypothetical protein
MERADARQLLSKDEQDLARAAAGRFLARAAAKSSAHMESFGTWLLAGEAGALVLLASSTELLKDLLNPTSVQLGLLFLGASMLCGVAQKFLGTSIDANASVAEEALALLAELGKRKRKVDFHTFFSEMNASTPRFLRPFAVEYQDRVLKGDYAAVGRQLQTFARVHSSIVVLQIALAALGFWMLTSGMQF